MKTILVLHAAAEPLPSALAAFLADALNARGAKVERIDACSREAGAVQPIHSAAIVCGGLHRRGGHGALLRFVKQNRDWLAGVPAAFVAVDAAPVPPSEAATTARHAAAQAFYRATGWTPAITHYVIAVAPAAPRGRLLGCLAHRADPPPPVLEGAMRDDLAQFADAFLRATGQVERGHAEEGAA